ncbi:hypothetical protein TNCT_708631 [Trichonephila clavata]|uniref:Uncharacterized protein n=1 Tax=Trichonephila clavata TaxID=2740835 RepID=A0A8X6EZW4_TRICU|nr:hypothetical protein TNCT_708631 [Trichonephila clavata]
MQSVERNQKSSIGKAESPLESLFEMWNEENQAIRIERLTSLERLHEYIVPPIPDAEPLLPTRNKMSMSIRMLCLRINVNLIHRMLLHIAIFFNGKLDGIIRAVLGLVEYPSTNPSEAKFESGEEGEKSISEDPDSSCRKRQGTKEESSEKEGENSTKRSNPELSSDQEDVTSTASGCSVW